jgi:tRNA-dihydrouridine synthase B
MRSHYANYFRGIPNFKESRTKLVSLMSSAEILNVLDEVAQMPELV